MHLEYILSPKGLNGTRRSMEIRDGVFRCIVGHNIRHRPVIGAGWVGITCPHQRPPGGHACGSSSIYLLGMDSLLAVEATEQEILHLQFRRLSVAGLLGWLGVSAPPSFRPVEVRAN